MSIVSGSLANIYASLDAYLGAHLMFPDGSPVAVRLHGVRRFVPPSDAPWVETHYDFLGLQSGFRNRIPLRDGMPRIATEHQGYLQLNLYQLARFFAQRYTTATIRDVVIGAFPDGELLPTYDYSDMTQNPLPQDGWFVLDGVKEHVQDNGMHSGVVQHILQVQTRYLELVTRSV